MSWETVIGLETHVQLSRHFETYFAVSGMGAILHTLNPRYSPDQLIYILNERGFWR